MALNSRAKGKRAELACCQALRDLFGWACRRSQQFSGWHPDSPDIICDQTPSLFFECKWVERLSLPRAMGLAVRQAGRKTPVILHRTSRSSHGWLLTIRLTDLPLLCHAFESAQHVAVASAPLPDQNSDSGSGGQASAGAARPVHPR